MPNMVMKSGAFDAMEGFFTLPEVTLTYQDALDVMSFGEPASDPKVLQLSSSLIRVSQELLDFSTFPEQAVTFEMRLSGSGIGPVSTLKALMNAINTGLAKGSLSKLEILEEGTSVLALTMDSSGYHLSSGDVTVGLTGKLPLTFTQFTDIAALLNDVGNLDFMNKAERQALFDDLSAYSVTGLSVSEGGHVLFGVHVGATEASLTLNGLTLTATGTFPSDLGEDVELLWGLMAAANARATPGTLPGGLSISALTLTDAAGTVLMTMADPLADTPLLARLDGRTYDTVEMGDNDGNFLSGYGRDRQVLAGLGGADDLVGGIKGDHLLGGTGNDTANGGAGADRLDGGAGRDVLVGGGGADVFHFDLGDGSDRITDFDSRVDVIEILDAERMSDLTMTQKGHDVQIDYRSIHILVEDITLDHMAQVINFHF